MRIRGRALLALLAALTMGAMAATSHANADPAPLDPLVDAAAQRLQIADPVAAAKWQTKTDIEDPVRVNQVLAAVTAEANVQHIDPDYVTQIFNDQISATEAIQYSRFAQWKFDPHAAPTSAPDVSASRSVIDALNRRIVDEIASHWDLLHSPGCAAALQDAKNAVTTARQLDQLYRQALAAATRSYCP